MFLKLVKNRKTRYSECLITFQIYVGPCTCHFRRFSTLSLFFFFSILVSFAYVYKISHRDNAEVFYSLSAADISCESRRARKMFIGKREKLISCAGNSAKLLKHRRVKGVLHIEPRIPETRCVSNENTDRQVVKAV